MTVNGVPKPLPDDAEPVPWFCVRFREGRLEAVLSDGTVLEGLPYNSNWTWEDLELDALIPVVRGASGTERKRRGLNDFAVGYAFELVSALKQDRG